jgi:hypothetical protein
MVADWVNTLNLTLTTKVSLSSCTDTQMPDQIVAIEIMKGTSYDFYGQPSYQVTNDVTIQ